MYANFQRKLSRFLVSDAAKTLARVASRRLIRASDRAHYGSLRLDYRKALDDHDFVPENIISLSGTERVLARSPPEGSGRRGEDMRTIARRVWRLETKVADLPRNRRISDQQSLNEKLEHIYQSARSRTPREDLQMLAEFHGMGDSCCGRPDPAVCQDAIDRWDQTYVEALQASPFRFTIQEIDLVVANADCGRLIHVKDHRP